MTFVGLFCILCSSTKIYVEFDVQIILVYWSYHFNTDQILLEVKLDETIITNHIEL